MKADILIRAGQVVSAVDKKSPLKGEGQAKVTVLEDAYVAIKDGRVLTIGRGDGREYCDSNTEIHDASGKALIPGLVDPHTHLVFAGWRAEEFALRLSGASYMDILAQGGGILDTVRRTREASEEDLLLGTLNRMDEILLTGTTTVEIKSGYGLDRETELKMLRVAKEAGRRHCLDIKTTFLGAHAVPVEFRGKQKEYLEYLMTEVLPLVAEQELADFADIFCEQGVFTAKESEELLGKAKEYGLKARLHADELVASGGAEVAAELRALSADHLLFASPEGVRAMAKANVIGTLLPGTSFFLKKRGYESPRRFIEAGVPLALGSDYNPGTCPTGNMLFVMALGVLQYDLLPEEALIAATLNAAYSLDVASEVGSLDTGKQADLVILKAPDYRHIFYRAGSQLVDSVYKKGILKVKNGQIVNHN